MITLNDGRNELWQWDTNRQLNVDADCSQVHFSNKVYGRSIDVDVVNGTVFIPDILLQTDKDLYVWAFVGTPENGYTKISRVFKINRRNKPADYVFTPVDQLTLEEIKEIAESVREDADNGLFNGEKGEKGEKGDRGEKGEPGQPGPQGEKGDKGEKGDPFTYEDFTEEQLEGLTGPVGPKGDPGYTPRKNVDYFDGKDGQPGRDGAPGKDGTPATHSWNGTLLTITSASGTSSADLKGDTGEPGKDGADGKDGYTPVKGLDYFTAEEQSQIAMQAAQSVPNEIVWVTLEQGDYYSFRSSHTPAQMLQLEEEGKTVLLMHNNCIYPPTMLNTGRAFFSGCRKFEDSDTVWVEHWSVDSTGYTNFQVIQLYPDTVRYGQQTLTEEQRNQARENLGIDDLSGADWNAAEGEPGHVLNRTHWVEKSVLLEETDAVETTDPNFGKMWQIPKAPNLTIGETYTVVYNGAPYDCVCQPVDFPGVSVPEDAVCMGNFSVVGGENTGEPFVLLVVPSEQLVSAIDLSGAAAVRIGIEGEIVHKLPAKFLPDDVGGTKLFNVHMEISLDLESVTVDKSFAEIVAAAMDENTMVRGIGQMGDSIRFYLPLTLCNAADGVVGFAATMSDTTIIAVGVYQENNATLTIRDI